MQSAILEISKRAVLAGGKSQETLLPPPSIDPAREEWNAVERVAFEFGSSYDSYLALDADRQFFWGAQGEGAVAYVPSGNSLLVSGGLLCPTLWKAQLLEEFKQFALAQRKQITFYNIGEEDLPFFRQQSFEVTKWGEEPVVNLVGNSFSGKHYEWVRRQSNYCQRQGLTCHEIAADEWLGPSGSRNAAEIETIRTSSLGNRCQAEETKFLCGRFDRKRIGRRRVFAARTATGEMAGFVIANPAEGGAMWTFETFRHRAGAIRGTVPFVMHQAMQKLSAEGAERVSLCLLPGRGVGPAMAGDSWLQRWSMILGTASFSGLHQTSGLEYFKSRFRPDYQARYVCAFPKVTIRSMWNFIRVLGIMKIDLRRWFARKETVGEE